MIILLEQIIIKEVLQIAIKKETKISRTPFIPKTFKSSQSSHNLSGDEEIEIQAHETNR